MLDRKVTVALLLVLLIAVVVVFYSRQSSAVDGSSSQQTFPHNNIVQGVKSPDNWRDDMSVDAQQTSTKKQCHAMLNSVEEWTPPSVPAHIQNLDQSDHVLVDHICEHWLLPPFTGPRHLANGNKQHYSQSGQSEFVDKVLNGRTDGFFIECGAAGGEGNSNSLFFEKHRNWKGLLIEANPTFFNLLLKANRHANMVNACLSPTRKPMLLDFREADQIGGLVDFMEAGHKKRVLKVKGEKDPIKVQCFPLFSILKALGITHIDYFSLDIEGAELDILRSIPFDEIKIDVFSIEYAVSNDGRATADKLAQIKDILVTQNGYKVSAYRLGREDVILTKL